MSGNLPKQSETHSGRVNAALCCGQDDCADRWIPEKGNSVSGKRQDIQIVVSGGAVAIFVSDLKRRVQPVEIVDVAGGIQNREWSIVDLGP